MIRGEVANVKIVMLDVRTASVVPVQRKQRAIRTLSIIG